MWWVEGSRLRSTANPISADSREKASQAPFAVSLFAGINTECLLRGLICLCRAGKQASWKGPLCLLYTRRTGRTGRGLLGASSGGVRGPLHLWGCRNMPRTKERHWLPHHLPQPSTPAPPPKSSALRILIPEYLAAPSMATVALPPRVPSASFLPAPSPCSPLPSPESGPQRGEWHTLRADGQSIHPPRRGVQAFTSTDTKPHRGQSPKMTRLCSSLGHHVDSRISEKSCS